MKRNVKAIMAVSLAALVLGGCSSTSSSNTANTQAAQETTAAQTTQQETTAETTAEVQSTEAETKAESAEKLVLKAQPEVNPGIANMPLRMYLSVTDYKDGILTCTLSNQTGSEMRYGKEYYLQKEENGAWKDVEAVKSYGWDKMAYMLKDLEETKLEFDLSVFGDLTPGKYQLVRDDSSAEFELIPESEAIAVCTGLPNASAMAGMANPVVETDADGMMQTLGFYFTEPKDAQNVRYSVIDNHIGQMEMFYNQADICVRAASENAFTDISGMYYTWDVEDTGKVGYSDAKVKRHIGEDETVDVCLWYDAAPGIMYSVTAVAPDLDGFDIIAVAEQVCPPMQGEVG